MTPEEKDIVLSNSGTEKALDVASFVSSAVPWVGGPISNVLSGVSYGRKLSRVKEVLYGLAEDLRDFKSEVSHVYVKTEDFEELLERTLQQATTAFQLLIGAPICTAGAAQPAMMNNRPRALIRAAPTIR